MSQALEGKQKIQEARYEYPYHYIPRIEDGEFSRVCYWPWGFRYLAGHKVVFEQLEKITFNSLVDIGCGDGRFIKDLTKRYPEIRVLGIDHSKRAIQLAEAINPGLEYKATDILQNSISERFDAATLIEVLEHIPTGCLPSFLKAVSDLINQKGYLVLTVPHINTPLPSKHYQHFKAEQLHDLLSKHFHEITIIPFDPRSKVMGFWHRLMGNRGKHFILTNHRLNYWFWKVYISYYLYTNGEQKCMRMAAVCKK